MIDNINTAHKTPAYRISIDTRALDALLDGLVVDKYDPGLYLELKTGRVTLESQMSPHNGQLEILNLNGTSAWPWWHCDITQPEIYRLVREAVREYVPNCRVVFV